MDLTKEDFPATLQAFELQQDKEIFIAEQVVNNQSEIDLFTSRYAGKLIKAKKNPVAATPNNFVDTRHKKQPSSTSIIMIIIILVFVILVIYGFSTGWIQEKLNLKI